MVRRKFSLANNPLLSGPTLNDRHGAGIPYREIALNLIDRDPNQPRVNFDNEALKDLSESIKTYGVLSPILVRPGKTAGRFQVIAGERRLRASTLAGLKTVPCLVDSESDSTGDRTLAIQLVENIQRADLTPLERAHAISALKEAHELSIRDVAGKLGVSKSLVQRSLDLLDLPDDLLNALREGASESKILLLAKVDDPEIRASYLKDLDVLTRSVLQKDVEKAKDGSKGSRGGNGSPEDRRVAEELQRALGLKVTLHRSTPNSDSGRLSIEFYSGEDLKEIYRKLSADS